MRVTKEIRLLQENESRYELARLLVKKRKRPTVATLQRFFDIGYGPAMNLVDVLKYRGHWPGSF